MTWRTKIFQLIYKGTIRTSAEAFTIIKIFVRITESTITRGLTETILTYRIAIFTSFYNNGNINNLIIKFNIVLSVVKSPYFPLTHFVTH